MAKAVTTIPSSKAETILSYEQDKSSENPNLSTIFDNLFPQLFADCNKAFLDLQFKPYAAILGLIADLVDDFNQALEQKSHSIYAPMPSSLPYLQPTSS